MLGLLMVGMWMFCMCCNFEDNQLRWGKVRELRWGKARQEKAAPRMVPVRGEANEC